MFIKISGYDGYGDEEWINTAHMESVRYNHHEKRYDVTMVNTRGHQVAQEPAMRELEKLLLTEPHEANPTYH